MGRKITKNKKNYTKNSGKKRKRANSWGEKDTTTNNDNIEYHKKRDKINDTMNKQWREAKLKKKNKLYLNNKEIIKENEYLKDNKENNNNSNEIIESDVEDTNENEEKEKKPSIYTNFINVFKDKKNNINYNNQETIQENDLNNNISNQSGISIETANDINDKNNLLDQETNLLTYDEEEDEYDPTNDSDNDDLINVENDKEIKKSDEIIDYYMDRYHKKMILPDEIEKIQSSNRKEYQMLIGKNINNLKNDTLSTNYYHECSKYEMLYYNMDTNYPIPITSKENFLKILSIPNIFKILHDKWFKNFNYDTINNRFNIPFNNLEQSIIPSIFGYYDFYFSEQNFKNETSLRRVYLMHIINHVLKARSIISRYNMKIKNKKLENNNKDHNMNNDENEYQDQGFTRAKVLILVPFRNTALKIIKIMKTLLPESIKKVENMDRFENDFSSENPDNLNMNNGKDNDNDNKNKDKDEDENINMTVHDDPLQEDDDIFDPKEEHKKIFEGNSDDRFQIGISLTNKSMRLYTDYYFADIIIASPLGLRTRIVCSENKDKDKNDFLSSIEIVTIDESSTILMQNWNHIIDIFKILNNMPKKAHDTTDFSRIREWNLNNYGQYYRQTILLSSFMDPLFKNILNKLCFNMKHLIQLKKTIYSGTINKVIPQVKQIFQYIDCKSINNHNDIRYNYFIEHIFNKLIELQQDHTMIYISSYFDYVRIRNLFQKNSLLITSCNCSEYSSIHTITRSRNDFYHGNKKILLYTGRCHFYKRYRMKGTCHIIFYDLPLYGHYYPEIINILQEEEYKNNTNISIIVLYTKYDYYSLERIVGTIKAKKMIHNNNNINKTYLFC